MFCVKLKSTTKTGKACCLPARCLCTALGYRIYKSDARQFRLIIAANRPHYVWYPSGKLYNNKLFLFREYRMTSFGMVYHTYEESSVSRISQVMNIKSRVIKM